MWHSDILVKITKEKELWLCAVEVQITPQAGNKAAYQAAHGQETGCWPWKGKQKVCKYPGTSGNLKYG